MYNYSGIIYDLVSECGILVLLGLIFIIISLLSKREEFQKRYALCGLAFLMMGIIFSFEYISVLQDPDVEMFEGRFYQEYRDSQDISLLPFSWEYTFCNEDGELSTFYLDTFSKKKIYNNDFSDTEYYQIFYEAQTKTIVKVCSQELR